MGNRPGGRPERHLAKLRENIRIILSGRKEGTGPTETREVLRHERQNQHNLKIAEIQFMTYTIR